MELKVLDNKGNSSRTVKIDDALANVKGSKAVLHEIVVAQLAGQRSGTHSTRTRSQVSGGGIKPWKQKGTGNARSGSTRSPLWRHGGIIFGPNPRNYTQDLPKKKKKLAFRMAFSGLLEDNRLQIVEPIALPEVKTKHVASVVKKWQAPTDSLLVVDKIDPNFQRAARNVANVRVFDVETLSAYDFLRARRVFMTETALGALASRLGKNGEEK